MMRRLIEMFRSERLLALRERTAAVELKLARLEERLVALEHRPRVARIVPVPELPTIERTK